MSRKTPRHDQGLFQIPELVLLWRPNRMSRSTIYRMIDEAIRKGVLKKEDYMLAERPKIDTTKRYKRAFRKVYWITREGKEKVEQRLGLMQMPVGTDAPIDGRIHALTDDETEEFFKDVQRDEDGVLMANNEEE